MKKIFATLIILGTLGSCTKQEFSDASNTITKADSLFTKANDGLKTLDSISKTINDSSGITRKVILPEIEKQRSKIDSTIKSGSWKIDSINKDIAEITKNVSIGTDVVKTLDSANKAINNGESAISVLTKTAGKILNQTRSKTQKQSSNAVKAEPKESPQNNTVVIPPIIERNPLVKTAILEIQVENISEAKSLLKQKIRDSNADLVSENFSQQEGFEREYITAKVPLYNFDNLVSTLSNGLGELKSKSMESQGKDYISSQMCDVEITLVQKELTASNQIVSDENNKDSDSFGSKSSSAFMSGFKVLGDMMIAILPFWPIFLIAGLIFYFVRRNKKNKEEQPLKDQTTIPVEKPETTTPSKIVERDQIENSDEVDYSKYLPKK